VSQAAIRRDGRRPDAPWRTRIAASVLSLGAALLALELVTRLFLSGPAPAADDQVRDGSEVIAWDAGLGWVLEPDARARQTTAEFDVEIATNHAGLRESADYDAAPAPGVRRVVALGDSFTFGYGVEGPESYPEVLERSLDHTEVLNLGVPGYGVDQMLLQLRERGPDLAPEVVLVGLFEGAVFRAARSFQLVYPKPRFELDRGALELTNVPVPELGSDRPPRAFPLQSVDLLATRGRDLWEHLGYGEAWSLTDRIVVAMQGSAAAIGASLLVVIIPKDRAIYPSGFRQAMHLRALRLVAALLERHGVAFVDTTPALTAWAAGHPGEPLYFAGDGHWTAAGHRVAAQAIEAPLRAALASADSRASTTVE
jgi:lysophospholipase L1-like esterase